MNDGTRKRRPQEGANFRDRAGERFGRLVVVRRAEDRPVPHVRKNGRPYDPEVQWLCICDCGNERIVPVGRLRGGDIKSCGCSRHDPRPSYRLKNPLPPGRAARNVVLKHYRGAARSRGLAWEMTEEEFDRLTSQDCFYCGVAPSTVQRGVGRMSGDFTYNGIDRVDNALGYLSGNVVPCCNVCNHAKKDMSYGEFTAWITRLTRFRSKRSAPAGIPSAAALF